MARTARPGQGDGSSGGDCVVGRRGRPLLRPFLGCRGIKLLFLFVLWPQLVVKTLPPRRKCCNSCRRPIVVFKRTFGTWRRCLHGRWVLTGLFTFLFLFTVTVITGSQRVIV